MLANDLVHIGASDGGAHIQSFATYGDTGYLFSEFVRNGRHLTLEHAVKKITGDTAQIWGLPDRGLLRRGLAADVVVFDPDTIGRGDELPVLDMPGGGMRYVRSARGVDTVIVNGEVAWTRRRRLHRRPPRRARHRWRVRRPRAPRWLPAREYRQKLAGQTHPLPDFILSNEEFMVSFFEKAKGHSKSIAKTSYREFASPSLPAFRAALLAAHSSGLLLVTTSDPGIL